MKKLVLFVAIIAAVAFSSCKKAATEVVTECEKIEAAVECCEKHKADKCEKAEGEATEEVEVIEVVEVVE